MRSAFWALNPAASVAIVYGATLDEVCTSSYAQASLPFNGFYLGITIDPSSLVVTPVTNVEVRDENLYPNAVFDYCNLPTPGNFQNRYLATGGGGYAINSGNGSLPGGIIYGAVVGATDGGFGSFDPNSDAVFLIQNGTVNWESLFMFGYEAIHELSALGKDFTKQFFNMSDTKLYSYYQACSEGGREGWSHVQRYGEEWDGAITVQHLYSNVVEQTLDYYPPPCELEKVVNETIARCDPLDGKTDGVVARSDLCKLHFNINSTIGKPYYCAATSAMMGPPKIKRQLGGAPSATPAQNGTVTAKGVAVAQEVINGLHDLQGRQVYLSYQPAASFADAAIQYNSATNSWELNISGAGAEFVARYLQLLNSSTLPNLDGVTYDTLKGWIIKGWQTYQDILQTTWPDLKPFHAVGGKVLHFHGESDNSIPTASSVRYYESVRQIMYPNMSFNESAAHCSPNTAQPNGPFPQTNLAVLINWVEKDVEPTTLNATVLQGEHIGENQQICAWPLRLYWTDNGTDMVCQYDQASTDTWLYDFDAFKLPVY
ncbi:hypothetical protein MMC30_007965 [Trapelia coarctata]|nr:hypothetical protein [Trapelia coarctata]